MVKVSPAVFHPVAFPRVSDAFPGGYRVHRESASWQCRRSALRGAALVGEL
jgi:hypothetical protein